MQNFGQIHETFKDILANAIVEGNDDNRKIFKTYVKTLKENSELKTQFQIFDRIENKVVGDETDKSRLFVDECISILKGLDKTKVNEANNKLINYLKKKGFNLTEDYENKSLHEHIHNLAFTNKNSKNIDSIVESKIFVNSYNKPLNESINKVVEPYSNKFLGPAMIEKFNSKYVGKLSETEKKTFKVIQSGSEEDKVKLYNETIIECVDLINTKLNEECTIQEKDKYLRVKDKLLRYNYQSEKFIDEISKIAYLKDTLK